MFDWAIRWSLRNRLTVIALYVILAGASIVAALNMAVRRAVSSSVSTPLPSASSSMSSTISIEESSSKTQVTLTAPILPSPSK